MGSLSYTYTYSSSYYVPSAVKCACYIAVGGGGGGAQPNVGYSFGRYPSAGGASCVYGVSGTCGGGGGPGQLYYGGYGGYGNYSYGQGGYYSSGPWSRARSGYGPYGTGGAGQWRSPSQSYGGGGGGASRAIVARGSNGAIGGQYLSWSVGSGGAQGGTGYCRYGQHGAVYINVCTYDPPIPSISASPTSFRADGSDGSDGTVDLTWTTGGGDSTSEILEALRSNVVVESFGQVARNRTSPPFVVSPTETTTYRLTTSNPAFSNSDSVTVTVYQKPVVNLYTTVPNDTIIQGQSIRLYWTTTGDADTLNIDNGVGQSNLNSNALVTPTVSTLYTAVASGLGGVGSDSLYVTVLQPPTISASGPISIDWQDNIIISVNATNVPGGITVTPTYTWVDGTTSVQPTVSLPNSSGDEIDIQAYSFSVSYDGELPLPLGPRSVFLYFVANGYGGLQANTSFSVNVVIDETPNVIDIPESEDTFKDEAPVITPDSEVTTQQILIEDIDIPVEVKADYPIQIEIDNDDTWRDVRQI